MFNADLPYSISPGVIAELERECRRRLSTATGREKDLIWLFTDFCHNAESFISAFAALRDPESFYSLDAYIKSVNRLNLLPWLLTLLCEESIYRTFNSAEPPGYLHGDLDLRKLKSGITNGTGVDVLDFYYEYHAEEIVKYAPNFVGLTVTSLSQLEHSLILGYKLKNLGCTVAMGGPAIAKIYKYVNYIEDLKMLSFSADYWAVGEADTLICGLAEAVRNDRDVEGLPNLIKLSRPQKLPRIHFEEMDTLACPDYSLWDYSLYLESAFTKENARVLRKAGCLSISLGMESSEQAILDMMHKGTRANQLPTIVNAFNTAGIAVDLMAFVGFPGETRQQAEATLRSAKKLSKIVATMAVRKFALTPGSLVARHPEDYGVEILRDASGKNMVPFYLSWRCLNQREDYSQDIMNRAQHFLRGFSYPFIGAVTAFHSLLYYEWQGGQENVVPARGCEIMQGVYLWHKEASVLEALECSGNMAQVKETFIGVDERCLETCVGVICVVADFERMAHKYGNHAHNLVMLEAGHVMQNAYLFCSERGFGVVEVYGCHAKALSAWLGIDFPAKAPIIAAVFGNADNTSPAVPIRK